MNAILFGATGLAGSGVLDECLRHDEIKKLTVVTRKKTGKSHAKLVEVIHDNFLDFSKINNVFQNQDVCFYCLGVSQSQVRDEKIYYKITYEYTMVAAKLLKELNPNLIFCFLSGAGTDPTKKSRFMWSRIKGKAENDLSKFNFKQLYLFRPGLIHPLGSVQPRLFVARILKPIYPLLNLVFPAYVTTTSEFGMAMINSALGKSEKSILENPDIRKLSKT